MGLETKSAVDAERDVTESLVARANRLGLAMDKFIDATYFLIKYNDAPIFSGTRNECAIFLYGASVGRMNLKLTYPSKGTDEVRNDN